MIHEVEGVLESFGGSVSKIVVKCDDGNRANIYASKIQIDTIPDDMQGRRVKVRCFRGRVAANILSDIETIEKP